MLHPKWLTLATLSMADALVDFEQRYGEEANLLLLPTCWRAEINIAYGSDNPEGRVLSDGKIYFLYMTMLDGAFAIRLDAFSQNIIFDGCFDAAEKASARDAQD